MPALIGNVEIHGHAIVSDDDCIAGPDGLTPAALRNDADWAYFQAALDAAAFTVLGRRGHEANPNAKARRRVVVSSSSGGLEGRGDGHWWNPAHVAFASVAAMSAPGGGVAAVPGGRDVFGLFLRIGFDAFHLVRAEGVRIAGGRKLFPGCADGRDAERVLKEAGLSLARSSWLDRAANVRLDLWRR